MNGKTLGYFRVGEQLGRGGMGEVYGADDLNLNRRVALKFLPDAFAGDPERMARFQREAKLLASLNHPNIAAIYGLEQAEGKRFLVLELVEGETLAQRISKGALPADDALAIYRQIAEGLEAAHEKGVIHRDLKPANVMITEGDKVKILDFGLAKALSDETQSVDSSQSPTLTEAMTRPGVILGTAAYMSPEQAKGKSVDKRADIWAFGHILYECLTGKRTFEGETVTETLAAVLTKEPEWAKAPAKAHPLLRRCLERDPKKRLRDIGDAIPLLEGLPEPVLAKSGFPWIAWAIAAVFLAAFAVMFLIHFRENPGTPPHPARFQIALPDQMRPSTIPTLALSPDGRYLAFSGVDSDGILKIWLRPLDSLVARPLPGTEGSFIAQSIIWSADSRFIAFNSGGELKRIAIDGGLASICSLSENMAG
ncbi:MAG TPA: protein kinase, partial [Acidobacteriota bacterium]|nr:protein kinase [Acidobacteriota bacterium]